MTFSTVLFPIVLEHVATSETILEHVSLQSGIKPRILEELEYIKLAVVWFVHVSGSMTRKRKIIEPLERKKKPVEFDFT